MTPDAPGKPGRPKKATVRGKLTLYLSAAERAAIDQARGDVERSTWIREAIAQRLTRERG